MRRPIGVDLVAVEPGMSGVSHERRAIAKKTTASAKIDVGKGGQQMSDQEQEAAIGRLAKNHAAVRKEAALLDAELSRAIPQLRIPEVWA